MGILRQFPSAVGVTAPGTVIVSEKQVSQSLTAGANTVTHNVGYYAIDVVIKSPDGSGNPDIYAGAVAWENVDENSISITIAADLANAVIDIFFKV